MGEPPQALSVGANRQPHLLNCFVCLSYSPFPPPDPMSGGLRDHSPQLTFLAPRWGPPHSPATTAAVPKPSYIPQAPSAGPLQALPKQAICLSLGPEPPSSHTLAPAEGERGAVMSDGLGWCRGRCRGAVGLKHTRQSSPCERTCPHHIPWCPLTFLVTSWKGLCAAHCALRGPPTTPYSARH